MCILLCTLYVDIVINQIKNSLIIILIFTDELILAIGAPILRVLFLKQRIIRNW